MTAMVPEESPIQQIIRMLMEASQQGQELPMEQEVLPEPPMAPEASSQMPPELMELLAQLMPQLQGQGQGPAIQRRMGGAPGMTGMV